MDERADAEELGASMLAFVGRELAEVASRGVVELRPLNGELPIHRRPRVPEAPREGHLMSYAIVDFSRFRRRRILCYIYLSGPPGLVTLCVMRAPNERRWKLCRVEANGDVLRRGFSGCEITRRGFVRRFHCHQEGAHGPLRFGTPQNGSPLQFEAPPALQELVDRLCGLTVEEHERLVLDAGWQFDSGDDLEIP